MPITAFFAALNAILLIVLAFKTIGFRQSRKVSLGDGGDEDLQKAMRGHGNAAETMPIALILMGLVEGLGLWSWLLLLLGALFTAGRVMHGLHFMGRLPMTFRRYGMICTVLAILTLAGLALILSLMRLF